MQPDYASPYKIYVDVDVRCHADGRAEPRAFIWEDGRVFTVDKVLDVRRAASLKAGGAGVRYTCRVCGKTTYLYLEENRWFMERRFPSQCADATTSKTKKPTP